MNLKTACVSRHCSTLKIIMNIGVDLRCLQDRYRTGVGEYAYELLNHVLKQDRTNRYFLFFNSRNSAEELPKFDFPNVTIAKFKFPNKFLNFCSLIFNRPQIDQLIAKKFGLNKLDYFYSPNLNFVSLSTETKHLMTIHDLAFELFPDLFTLKQLLWHRFTGARRQCHRAEKIFVPSKNTARDLVKYFQLNPEKIILNYPGISSLFTDRSLAATGKKPGLPEKYLLFLGTIEPRKNIGALLTAFESVAFRFPELSLVIAGAPGWKNRPIINRIKKSAVRERIFFTGHIPGTDKPSLFRNAILFIYPSLYEGFGFPVLEAMASRIPVVTSNRSSLPEITAGAAFLVDPNRPEEIADGITKILSSDTSWKKYSEMGQKQAEKFNWETSAKTWLENIK